MIDLDRLPHLRRFGFRQGYRSFNGVFACENCGQQFDTSDFDKLLFETTRHRNLECKTPDQPIHCAQVDHERHRGEGFDDRPYTADPGDLVWDPKMGEGHVIKGEVMCEPGGKYCGYCGQMGDPHPYLVCLCGGFDVCDHHGYLLARR